MKLLLVGPYPPPHGGISVHVKGLEERSRSAGIPTRVLNSNNAGPTLIAGVFAAAWTGWTIHFHTNGHNPRSWILAGVCGLAAATGAGGILTLHSGMAPGYLKSASRTGRFLARAVCSLYRRIVCVSSAIRTAITHLGVRIAKTEVAEAYLGVSRVEGSPRQIDDRIEEWMRAHRPVLSAAMFFRPEYGLDTLLAALQELRRFHPCIGCVVMGDSAHRSVGSRQIADAALEEHVLLTGDIEHDVCLHVISRSDAFVRPTTEDGDSVSVREAVGLGIPVAASRVGTRPAEAILFPPEDPAALAIAVRLALEKGSRMEKYA